MKIAIDISQIVYGTGVSVYTKELVKNLLKYDNENEYILFGGSLRRQFLLRQFALSLKGNFKTKILPYSPATADFIWNRVHRLKVERLIGKIDVVHASDWTQPPTTALKVTTVHDLAPFKFPKLTHPRIVAVHKRRMYWVLKEVDKIIVPSLSTKNDLVKLGAKEEKVRVIPEAAGEEFKPQTDTAIEVVKRKYGLRGDYLITIGMGERKNTKRLIEAFQKVKAHDLKLVIVGHKTMNLANERGVITPGFVPDSDLPALLGGSVGLVYVPLYEGFGLPIIQAFACGTPVVTSNTSSMPEVASNAAVLVNPERVSEISDGIKEILKKPKEYSKKGLKRAKDFSWEKTAKMTLDVYMEL